MYPDNIFAASEIFKKATHTEFVKMERGCLSLMFSMLNDWFHPFSQLPHEIKVAVLQNYSIKFGMLDSVFRTYQIDPEANGNRWIFHYAQYIDSEDVEFFFKDDKDPAESARLFKSSEELIIGIKKKLTKLKITESEVSSLFGIMLWNEVSYLLPEENGGAEQIRDQIYSELHNYLILRYGVSGTGARLGALLFILHEINVNFFIFISNKINHIFS